jgi:predicted N-formylglutamate amidohydrolase
VDYAAAAFLAPGHLPPVLTFNAKGTSPFVLVCDHASNRIPHEYAGLGLTPIQRLMHIAWDPGALALAKELAALLDAPLVHSTVSRLVIDCNRDHDAHDLITTVSELTEIAANAGIPAAERKARIARHHAPYHDAIDAMLGARFKAGIDTILVAVHSFTPTYRGVARPWPIGLIHGRDESFTAAFRDALLAAEPDMNVGWNEPYSALNGVTFTLEHHGDGRGLPAVMIEVRHDEILDQPGVTRWALTIARALAQARSRVPAAVPRSAAI